MERQYKRGRRKGKKMRRGLMVLAILLAIAVLYVLISLWASAYFLTVRRFQVDLNNGGAPIRAVVISDLHDREFGEKNEKLAEKIKEQEPDLILMVGDMLNEDSKDAHAPVELISSLYGTAPIYYSLGNHEENYIDSGHSELIEQLEAAGAVVLDRSYADLEVNGVQLRLGGMYDYAFGLNGNNDALAAPENTLNFLQDFQDTDRMKIMLAHRPDSFIFGDASKVWDVDLVISGHNHGGQVVIPFLGGLHGGDQGWFPEYIHGLYQKDNLQIFVTSGLGSSGKKLPRFNNPPEVAMLTIK